MYAFVDTETTGFARGGVQPRIVSIAWMIAEDPARPRVLRYSIVRPEGFSIPAGAQAVHGISTQRALEEGQPLPAVLRDFARDMRSLAPRAIIAHNAAYDLPIIAAEFERTGLTNPCQGRHSQCTMLAARRKWPGESAKLGDVYRRLFRAELAGAHNAQADVLACAHIFFALQGAKAPANAAPPMAAERRDDDAPEILVGAVLEWAETRPGFDSSFVESLRDRLETGRRLTEAQQAALRNIIARWHIPV